MGRIYARNLNDRSGAELEYHLLFGLIIADNGYFTSCMYRWVLNTFLTSTGGAQHRYTLAQVEERVVSEANHSRGGLGTFPPHHLEVWKTESTISEILCFKNNPHRTRLILDVTTSVGPVDLRMGGVCSSGLRCSASRCSSPHLRPGLVCTGAAHLQWWSKRYLWLTCTYSS
jgi:hypothetical protein